MKIGEIIKDLREKNGFTQSIVANYLGVDQSLISKIEKNERSATADMLDKLSALFCVPVTDIVNNKVNSDKLVHAFRSDICTPKDLEAISAINKIALNSYFMSNLLGDSHV